MTTMKILFLLVLHLVALLAFHPPDRLRAVTIMKILPRLVLLFVARPPDRLQAVTIMRILPRLVLPHVALQAFHLPGRLRAVTTTKILPRLVLRLVAPLDPLLPDRLRAVKAAKKPRHLVLRLEDLLGCLLPLDFLPIATRVMLFQDRLQGLLVLDLPLVLLLLVVLRCQAATIQRRISLPGQAAQRHQLVSVVLHQVHLPVAHPQARRKRANLLDRDLQRDLVARLRLADLLCRLHFRREVLCQVSLLDRRLDHRLVPLPVFLLDRPLVLPRWPDRPLETLLLLVVLLQQCPLVVLVAPSLRIPDQEGRLQAAVAVADWSSSPSPATSRLLLPSKATRASAPLPTSLPSAVALRLCDALLS